MKRIGKLAATLVFNSAAILALIALVTSAFAQQPAMGAVALGSATLPPGAMIKAANVQNYTRFLPPGADVFVQHGLTIRVVPSKRLDWSAGFTAETEKYSGQVGLDKDDYITNYVAGMPFPTVDINDPKAAVKIAYNWHMGPFMPDDFSQEPWGSFAYSTTGSPNGIVQEEWADYTCTHFVFLRYAHRTEVDPRPSLVANDDGVEWKARCLHWKGGPDMSPSTDTSVTGFVVRYLDPRKPDREVFFKGGSQKYRGGYVSDERCRACHQPYWAYALPKTEEYSYRLLGTTLVLGCLTADHEPAGIVEHQGALALSEEPFQLRNAYVLEMAPRADEKLRTLVYIDAEATCGWVRSFFSAKNRPKRHFHFGGLVLHRRADISLIWRASSTFPSASWPPSIRLQYILLLSRNYSFVRSRQRTVGFYKRLMPAPYPKTFSIRTCWIKENEFQISTASGELIIGSGLPE